MIANKDEAFGYGKRLLKAARAGEGERVRELLPHCQWADEVDSQNRPALYWMFEMEQNSLFTDLVLDKTPAHLITPLVLVAAAQSAQDENILCRVIEMVLNRCQDSDYTLPFDFECTYYNDNPGRKFTILQCVISRKFVQAATMLIEGGVQFAYLDSRDRRALHSLCFQRMAIDAEQKRKLLQNGATSNNSEDSDSSNSNSGRHSDSGSGGGSGGDNDSDSGGDSHSYSDSGGDIDDIDEIDSDTNGFGSDNDAEDDNDED